MYQLKLFSINWNVERRYLNCFLLYNFKLVMQSGGQENLILTTNIAIISKYGYDLISFKNRKAEVKKSIRAKGLNSKICVALFCVAMLLNINTIECMSDQSSTTPAPSTGGEYFTSVVRMKELARLEQSMIAEMSTVLENSDKIGEYSSSVNLWQEGLLKMKSYLHDYDSSIRTVLFDTTDVEIAVISHPLMSYRMLRRVVFNLPEILNCNVEGRLEKLTNITALIQPGVTEDDVVGAMQGIIRLQQVYLIHPYDFTQGRLLTFDTKSGLTEMDCFRIGNLALNENKQSSIAIEWLLQALRMCLQIEVESSSGLNITEMVRHGLRKAIEVHNNDLKDKKPWTFGKEIPTSLSEMTRDNENELIKSVPSHPSPSPYQLFIPEYTKFDEINFYGLCRGDKLRNETLTKDLKCYYKTDNPFLAIKPLKVEVHSKDPLVMQFYDVLPDLIIKQFTNTASHRLKRALVSINRTVSQNRIACNAFIDDKKDEILSKVPSIIQESTDLNLIPVDSSEMSQISTYGGIGGYYIYHYDTLYTNPDSKSTLDVASKATQERIATFMFYLSDLKLGGGTAFPKIGVCAEPIKGSAIFWYNLKKNGQRHHYTMHGGCPVLLGEKWVVNKWIRSGDQMFVRKCSLDPNM